MQDTSFTFTCEFIPTSCECDKLFTLGGFALSSLTSFLSNSVKDLFTVVPMKEGETELNRRKSSTHTPAKSITEMAGRGKKKWGY